MTREPRFRRRALLALLLTLLVSAFRPAPAAALAPFPALTLASFALHTDFNVSLFAAAPSRSATVAYSLNASPMASLRRGFSVFSTIGSGPIISNATVTPNPPPVTGGNVTVSADVTDSSASISTVYANIYDPGGNLYARVLLTNTSGSTYSSSIVNIPENLSNSANGYSIKVQATDNSSNTAITGTLATQGFDSTAPTIANASVTPSALPVTGGNVTVSANVTDAGTGVGSVFAYIYDPSGNLYNQVRLTNTSGSTYSSSIVNIPENLSNSANGFSIKVFATDRSNNTAATGTLATQGFDNVPPVISNAAVAPNPPPVTGGNVTVSADVTDAGTGVGSVYALVIDPNGNLYSQVLLTNTSGSTYSRSVNIPENLSNSANGFSIKVVATDRSNNTAITGTLAVQGFDNVAPTISNITQTPSLLPESGGQVTVSATVTDAGTGVGSVSALIYKDGATGNAYSYSATLSNGGTGNVYTGTYTIGASGNTATHTFAAVVFATDRSNNTSSNNTGNLVYQSDGAPNPVPTITSLSPNHVAQGTTTDTTIYVIGSSFVPQSTVLLNGSPVPTTYDGNIQLHFTLPASAAVNAGTITVQVNNPALFGTDGGTSNSVALTIDTTPTITNAGISPPTLPAGGGVITISAQVASAYGVNSVTAVIKINGTDYTAVGLSNGGTGDIYIGTFNAGANTDAAARVYTAVIHATNSFNDEAVTNAAGQTTQQPITYTDVTSRVSVTRSALTHDAQGQYQILTVTNTSRSAIQGPIQVAITRLTSGVGVSNASGNLADGSPYLTATTNSLAAGGSFQVRVNFSNPNNKRFSYGVQVYSGTF